MRWRLVYVLRLHGITEDEPSWTDTERVWNMEGVESDGEAGDKAKTFLEGVIRQNGSIQSYKLVRVVQEEITVPVRIPPLKSYSELKWPKEQNPPRSRVCVCGFCKASFLTVEALYAHQQKIHDPDGIMFSDLGLPK